MSSRHYATLLGTSMALLASAAVAQPTPAPDLNNSPATPSDASAGTPATGTEADVGRLQEIIVTAQRRAENLQSVPIAVTAFTAAQLGQAGIATTQDLAVATPGLSIGASQGYLQPRIRGIGTSGAGAGIENPVALYVDGVYYASAPASLLSLAGVERVEVLKGPQGTLFGRNATGGLVQVITRDPGDHVEGSVDIGLDNYRTITADAYYSTPITDTVGASISLHSAHQDKGYGTNIATGQDVNQQDEDIAARGKLVGRVGDAKFTLAADYIRLLGSNQAGRLPPGERSAIGGIGNPDNRPWDVDVDVTPLKSLEGGGTSLRGEIPLGSLKVMSISAYRRSQFRDDFDYDLTPVPVAGIEINQSDRQLSQEIQIASNGTGRFNWVAGAFYFNAKSSFNPITVGFFGVPAGQLATITTRGTQDTKSLAGFGEATIALGNSMKFTGGVRYTSEKRTIDGQQTGTLQDIGVIPLGPHVDGGQRFNKVTFRAALDRKLADAVLAYASFNRGFKSGGFNPQLPADPAYKAEVVDAYEVGLKSDLLDRRLRVNIAGFYYNYSNIQVPTYTSTGQARILNGAKARIYGIDVDAQAVVSRNLRLNAGLSILHDRFTDYPNAVYNVPLATGGSNEFQASATGNRLPLTPDWTVNVGGTYTVRLSRGRLDLEANYFHSDGYFTEADNIRRQHRYDQVSASLTWHDESDHFSVGAFGRNLTNAAVALQIVGAQIAGNAAYQPPRTYGLTVGVKY